MSELSIRSTMAEHSGCPSNFRSDDGSEGPIEHVILKWCEWSSAARIQRSQNSICLSEPLDTPPRSRVSSFHHVVDSKAKFCFYVEFLAPARLREEFAGLEDLE